VRGVRTVCDVPGSRSRVSGDVAVSTYLGDSVKKSIARSHQANEPWCALPAVAVLSTHGQRSIARFLLDWIA
jgi:hypothetical protein